MIDRSVVVSWVVVVVMLAACSSSGSGEESRKQESSAGQASAASQAATAASATPAGAASGPARRDMDCEEYVRNAQEMSKGMDIKAVYEEGSWGPIPAPLQVLPPGATFCALMYFVGKDGQPQKGSGAFVSTIIKTPLFGKDLQAAYEPIMSKAGCTFNRDTSTASITGLSWTCPKEMCGGGITMGTDVAYNFASMACLIP